MTLALAGSTAEDVSDEERSVVTDRAHNVPHAIVADHVILYVSNPGSAVPAYLLFAKVAKNNECGGFIPIAVASRTRRVFKRFLPFVFVAAGAKPQIFVESKCPILRVGKAIAMAVSLTLFHRAFQTLARS